MELEQLLVPAILSFVGVALLSFFARRHVKDQPETDDDAVLERNATAYKIVSGLFLGSLIIPTSFYYLAGVDDNEAWPAVTGFLLSATLPVGYLSLRTLRGGPNVNEFMRYCELKDGWPRKWQIAIFYLWLAFVAGAIVAAALMS
jgi:uncharacterized membrane protein YoaK (UPF0700 family)